MMAGGRCSANSTLPVRSPWMSWRRASTGSSAAARRGRCLTCAKSSAGSLTPGDAVADCPRICAPGDEVGARDADESGVKAPADRDDLRPAAFLVPTFNGLPRAPAINDE